MSNCPAFVETNSLSPCSQIPTIRPYPSQMSTPSRPILSNIYFNIILPRCRHFSFKWTIPLRFSAHKSCTSLISSMLASYLDYLIFPDVITRIIRRWSLIINRFIFIVTCYFLCLSSKLFSQSHVFSYYSTIKAGRNTIDILFGKIRERK